MKVPIFLVSLGPWKQETTSKQVVGLTVLPFLKGLLGRWGRPKKGLLEITEFEERPNTILGEETIPMFSITLKNTQFLADTSPYYRRRRSELQKWYLLFAYFATKKRGVSVISAGEECCELKMERVIWIGFAAAFTDSVKCPSNLCYLHVYFIFDLSHLQFFKIVYIKIHLYILTMICIYWIINTIFNSILNIWCKI